MTVDRIITGCPIAEDDDTDRTLRPRHLADYVGQVRIKQNLAVFIEAASARGEAIDHILFHGPPGLGKTDLNNENPRDTCPPGLWDNVNAEALKKQYEVLGVFKNGPRHWAMDWIELPVGSMRTFDGLQARWMGEVQLPKGVDLHKKGSSAYRPTTVERKSQMGFEKGKPVFILEDPDGTPWIMQAYSNIVDPNLTYEDLQTLDKKLKLPPGWKYRVKILDQDLTIRAVKGRAKIVQDDLENTYDACFEEGGEKSCSYKP